MGRNAVLQDSYVDMCSVCVGAIGGTSIVEIAGEVDIATVSMLAKALNDAVRSGKGNIILDAQKLTYVDSAGLQTLLSTQRQLATKNRRMAIVGCHGIFHKLLKTSRLDEQFHMYSTVDEALIALNDWDVPTT
jgi:anti-sigma B factor antagonist